MFKQKTETTLATLKAESGLLTKFTTSMVPLVDGNDFKLDVSAPPYLILKGVNLADFLVNV